MRSETIARMEKPRPRSTGLLRFHGGTSDGGGNRHQLVLNDSAFIIKQQGRRLQSAPSSVSAADLRQVQVGAVVLISHTLAKKPDRMAYTRASF